MVFYQDPPPDEGDELPFVAFVRAFAFGGPPPMEPLAKTEVGIADLREYLHDNGYAPYAAYRVWDIIITRLLPVLAKDPINLDVAANYVTDGMDTNEVWLQVADLKAMVTHLRPQMVPGYMPLMHRELCAWIASL